MSQGGGAAAIDGWLRNGGRIRDQIGHHLRKLERTQERPGVFLWKTGTVSPRFPFRRPQSDEHRRALSDIFFPNWSILSYRIVWSATRRIRHWFMFVYCSWSASQFRPANGAKKLLPAL